MLNISISLFPVVVPSQTLSYPHTQQYPYSLQYHLNPYHFASQPIVSMPDVSKHVRFNERNIEYSPAPSTPSPAYSISSLPSSSGPITPPTPFTYNSPLPSTYSTPVLVHPYLGFQPHTPSLLYDLSMQASTVAANAAAGARISSRTLAEPATQPPLPSLTIIHNQLPWSITIHASSAAVGVTCFDVLDTLYRSLRLAVTPAEFNSLPSMEAQKRVSLSYQSRYGRYHRGSREYEEEKGKGVKRVDFLAGRNRFMGLESTKQGPHIWLLHTTS